MKIHTKYFEGKQRQSIPKEIYSIKYPDHINPSAPDHWHNVKGQEIVVDNCWDYDLNRQFNRKVKLIPFNIQKAPNGIDNWVYFDIPTENWIYHWLNRIVLEYQHKVKTYPTALAKLDQVINKKGTYDKLNTFNTVLTTCSGLVLNRERAKVIKFTTKQLADIEKVFDIATYVFRDTSVKNHNTGEIERSVLTDKDIGWHRITGEQNEDIMRIYFIKNPVLKIGASGEVYDPTPIEILFEE